MPQAEVGALRLRLSLNAAELTEGMKRAEANMVRFGRRMERLGASATRAGALISAPFVALGAVSLRSASDFGKAMANVSTLVDTTTESMKGMEKAVLQIAKRTPVAIQDLTGALYDIRSAGVSAGDAMGVLEGSARLAVAGLGSTKEAVDLVTSATNAFNLAGDEQARIYDVIFKTVKNGKTNISQLAQGFGAVAGTVAAAGIEIDEYLASIAALTTTGLPAAQAHTQIRAAIAGLTRETQLSEKVFSQLGAKTFKDLIQQSGGMVEAFRRISDALGGNDAEMIKLFGSVEAYNAVLGLTGGQNAAFTQTLKDMRDGANAVNDAFDKQNKELAAVQQRWTNVMESLAVSLGTILAPTVEKIAGALSDLAEWFDTLSDETKEWVVTIGTVVAAVGTATAAMGIFATAIGGLLPVIAAVRTAIAAVFTLGAGPIAGVIAAAALVWAAWEPLSEAFSTLFGGIASDAEASAGRVSAAYQEAIDKAREAIALQAVLGAGVATETGILGGSTPSLGDLLDTEEGGGSAPESSQKPGSRPAGLGSGRGGVGGILGGGAAQVTSEVDKVLAELDRLNQSAAPIIKKTTDALGDGFGDAAKKAEVSMSQMANDVTGALSTIFGNNKAIAIASAVINTAEAVTKALSAYPPPVSFAMAGLQAAAGAAQIATIRSTTEKGGGSVSASSGAVSGAASSVAAAQPSAQAAAPAQQAAFIQIEGDSFSRDGVLKLIEKINDAQADGAKLTVVHG